MKNTLKRLVSILSISVLLFGIFTVIGFAATPNYSVSGGTVTVGSDITVNVTLSSSSNAAGGNFTLQYDNSKLTPKSFTTGSLLSGYTTNCNLSYSNNSIRFTFSGTNALTSSGTVVSIVFTSKATGSASLSFVANKLYDINGTSISSTTTNNTITINSVSTTYTVTYNANGGSVSPTSATVTSGNSTTLPTPTKSYKITYNANGGSGAPSAQNVSLTCKGWATSSSATSASYTCGSNYKPSGNVTLYAVWTSPVSATLSSTKPTKDGYTFLGWSTSSSATSSTYSSGGSISLDGNKTLYAVWKLNESYTVTYNANGGTVSPTSATVTSGNSTTLPTPTKSYKITYNANGGSGAPSAQNVSLTCKGWATSSSATSASYTCGSNYKPSGSVTLYAVWTSPVSATLSSTKPTKDGYTFLGWATSNSATSATYNSGDNISVDGNKTLYAVWKVNPSPTNYTLNYDSNGGTGSPSSQSGNGYITISNTVPTRKGYYFLGWSESPDASVPEYASGASYYLSSNTTLYAVWSLNPSVEAEPTIQIRNYVSQRNEAYRTSITFTAEAINAPSGSSVHWYLNGQDVYTGERYIVKQARNSYEIQAKLIASNGSILSETKSETVTIKTGFFARIIAFFRNLFGLLPVITQ